MDSLKLAAGTLAVVVAINVGRYLPGDERHPSISDEPASVQAAETSHKRIFVGEDGTRIAIETPLIDSFPYVGDEAACDDVVRFLKENGEAGWEDDSFCRTMPPPGSPERDQQLDILSGLATDLEEAQNDISQTQMDERIRFALGVLHERLDDLGDRDAQTAYSALLGSNVSYQASDDFYPGETEETFPLRASVEAGEARLALCPIVRPTWSDDCFEEAVSLFVDDLVQYGRLKSDETMLLHAADLIEQRYHRIKAPDLDQETDFVDSFTSALGYAGELQPDDRQAVRQFRRSVRAALNWLAHHETTADKEDVIAIYDGLAADYGRIAGRSHTQEDARIAIDYSQKTRDLMLERGEGEKGAWTGTSNLADAYIDLGDLDHVRANYDKALALHRTVLAAIAPEEGRWPIDAADVNYARFKLARTLLHYEWADLDGIDAADHRAMLGEAQDLATTARTYFSRAGTAKYVGMLDDILAQIDMRLARL
ncbi:hypothetical protein [Consotaella aegiceratis]|uniref:hypothetical protein n=1 Tax=Consotaella aegiceratis TaxID=3097961 RepID=UPI002F40E634